MDKCQRHIIISRHFCQYTELYKVYELARRLQISLLLRCLTIADRRPLPQQLMQQTMVQSAFHTKTVTILLHTKCSVAHVAGTYIIYSYLHLSQLLNSLTARCSLIYKHLIIGEISSGNFEMSVQHATSRFWTMERKLLSKTV